MMTKRLVAALLFSLASAPAFAQECADPLMALQVVDRPRMRIDGVMERITIPKTDVEQESIAYAVRLAQPRCSKTANPAYDVQLATHVIFQVSGQPWELAESLVGKRVTLSSPLSTNIWSYIRSASLPVWAPVEIMGTPVIIVHGDAS